MNKIDWDLTVDTIKNGKCVLFLGPGIFHFAEPPSSLEDRLLNYLRVEEDPGVRVYNDGLYFFKERQKRTATYLKMRRFYEENSFARTKGLLEKIARIPFHFIISLTPDNLLRDAFQAARLNVRTGFYWKRHAPDLISVIPTVAQPLIYQMLGSIDRPESVVLTHDDLFDYMESVFQAQNMSEKLRDHLINEAHSIVFLGIPFDRWYMHLLLRVLGLHRDEEFMRFAASQELSEEVQTLCKEQFKINFILNNTEEFIEEIYGRCETAGLLRQPRESQASVVQTLKEAIAADRLEEAFSRFRQWLEGLGAQAEEMLDDVLLVSNRHRRLNRKIIEGILSNEEAGLESARIRKSLLDLVNEAKGFE